MTGTFRTFVAVAVVFSALTLPGCRTRPDRRELKLPPSPPEVFVTMAEYRFDYDDNKIPPGRVLFRFANVGRRPHRPTLLPLAEHLPPIDQQLRGDVRRVVPPFAGITTRVPGKSGVISVDLVPGQRYALICTFADDEGGSHAVKGMSSEFRTTGRPGGPSQTS